MRKVILTIISFMFISYSVTAQGKNEYKFNEIKHNVIKGAPKLSNPKFLFDEKGKLLIVEKTGHCAPLAYDWDGDGVLDILIGEFSNAYDCNIKVYINKGKNHKPKYSSKPFYATDISGDKLAIYGY